MWRNKYIYHIKTNNITYLCLMKIVLVISWNIEIEILIKKKYYYHTTVYCHWL